MIFQPPSKGGSRLSGKGETSWANSPDKFFNWGKRLRRNFLKIYWHFFAGAAKIAVFTTLACITIQVLLSILPLIPATILLAITGATVTIFPIANYIIMFIAVRYHSRKVQDMVSSQQLQGIVRREKKVAINMLIVSVVLGICVIPKYVVTYFCQSFGSLYPSLFVSFTTLLTLNSSTNPVLYIWWDPGLRAALSLQ